MNKDKGIHLNLAHPNQQQPSSRMESETGPSNGTAGYLPSFVTLQTLNRCHVICPNQQAHPSTDNFGVLNSARWGDNHHAQDSVQDRNLQYISSKLDEFFDRFIKFTDFWCFTYQAEEDERPGYSLVSRDMFHVRIDWLWVFIRLDISDTASLATALKQMKSCVSRAAELTHPHMVAGCLDNLSCDLIRQMDGSKLSPMEIDQLRLWLPSSKVNA